MHCSAPPPGPMLPPPHPAHGGVYGASSYGPPGVPGLSLGMGMGMGMSYGYAGQQQHQQQQQQQLQFQGGGGWGQAPPNAMPQQVIAVPGWGNMGYQLY